MMPFMISDVPDAMLAALKLVASQLGQTYPLWINGEAVTTGETFDSTSPADPSRVVGKVCKANAEHAERAVRCAAEAFKSWSHVDPDARARILLKAAAIMRDADNRQRARLLAEKENAADLLAGLPRIEDAIEGPEALVVAVAEAKPRHGRSVSFIARDRVDRWRRGVDNRTSQAP